MNNTNGISSEQIGKIIEAFSSSNSESNSNQSNDNGNNNSQFGRTPKNSKLASVGEFAFMCSNTSELINEMKKLAAYNAKLTNSATLSNKIVLALVQENKTLRVNSNMADSVSMRTLDEYMSASDNLYTDIVRSRANLDPNYVNGSVLNVGYTSPTTATNANNKGNVSFDSAVGKITNILQNLSSSDEVIYDLKENK